MLSYVFYCKFNQDGFKNCCSGNSLNNKKQRLAAEYKLLCKFVLSYAIHTLCMKKFY